MNPRRARGQSLSLRCDGCKGIFVSSRPQSGSQKLTKSGWHRSFHARRLARRGGGKLVCLPDLRFPLDLGVSKPLIVSHLERGRLFFGDEAFSFDNSDLQPVAAAEFVVLDEVAWNLQVVARSADG